MVGEIKMAELLAERLELVFEWYQGMVNPESGRLEYLYLPQTDDFVREKCPIRDLGSLWEIELLSDFLHRQELRRVIEKSLRDYTAYLVKRDGCLILDARHLEENSSIAHSAFLLLALLRDPRPRKKTREISALAEGILKQQRRDGSFKIYFDDLPDAGEELYSGEAILALLEYNRVSPSERCIQSAARGLEYYDAQYFRNGRVEDDLLVFFANWQSQAARVLFDSASDVALKQKVSDYVFRLHDAIIEGGFYAELERHPARRISVEVACALEGLNDAFAIANVHRSSRGNEALTSSDLSVVSVTATKRVVQYRECICVGLNYLLGLQCMRDGTEKERGGFGVSFSERAQRIDITGHAASAFMKSLENGIECE